MVNAMETADLKFLSEIEGQSQKDWSPQDSTANGESALCYQNGHYDDVIVTEISSFVWCFHSTVLRST